MKRLQNLFVFMLAVTFLLMVSISNNSFASDQLSVIKQRGKIIAATSADYAPYESVDDSGQFVGFDVDLINEIAKRIGVEVEIKDMGFDTLIVSLQEKKVDLIIAGMVITPEREQKVDFTVPYCFVRDAFVVKKDAGLKITEAQDAGGKKIGVLSGTVHETWVRENLIKPGLTKEDELFLYDRMDMASLDLGAGRVDVILLVKNAAEDVAAKMKNLEVALVVDRPAESSGMGIAVAEGETALKAELDRIINELKNDGWLERKAAEYRL
jgi:polar amino acid transport system substrate-binding protein